MKPSTHAIHSDTLNYKHLHYFWVVAKEGGFARAAERLDVSIQTVSAQVRELEKSLGHQLLKPQGRSVGLTEAGRVAFDRAEEIFQIGQLLHRDVQDAATRISVRLAVGLSDSISKLAAHAQLCPVLDTPHLRLICHEGEMGDLLGELVMHQLDMVLSGHPAPADPKLKLTSVQIASSPIEWWGSNQWVEPDGMQAAFPASLEKIPVLLPTHHAALRSTLDAWFEEHKIQPNVVGEFEDSALMAVFAARGMGVFPVSRLGAQDLTLMRDMTRLATTDIHEQIHAIYTRRGQHHPLVQKIIPSISLATE